MDMQKSLKFAKAVLNQYGYKLIIGQIPRMIYGNDAGFINNIKASRELAQFRRTTQLDFPTDEKVNFLTKEGYLRIDPACSKEIMDRIVAKHAELIHDDKHSTYIGPRVREAIRAINEPIISNPDIRFLLTDEIKSIIEAHYKTHMKVVHVRCWRTHHVDGVMANQDVYSNLWHNDPHPITLLRLFVYLTDNVNYETGAFRLHNITSTKKLMRNGYLRRRAIVGPAAKIIESPSSMIVFEGNKGAGCIANPQLCLHRAGIPAPGKYRDMVQFTLAPSSTPLSENWHLELPLDNAGVGY